LREAVFTVTKKELCIWLGLAHPGGKLDYESLRDQYFTPKALQIIGIDQDNYKNIRKFNPVQSQKIIDLFNLRTYLRQRKLL
jgi:hypothetical protein